MSALTRRSLATGLAAAVSAIPAIGFSVGKGDPAQRIKHHTAELEKAMRDRYGVEVQVLSFEDTQHVRPLVMVVAHTR